MPSPPRLITPILFPTAKASPSRPSLHHIDRPLQASIPNRIAAPSPRLF